MVALVVIAKQIIIGRGRSVLGIVESANLLRGLDHLVKGLRVVNELRQDAKTAFGRFIQENVGRSWIADGDNADLVWLDLEDRLNSTLERVLKRDDAGGVKPERLDWFDVQGVGEM